MNEHYCYRCGYDITGEFKAFFPVLNTYLCEKCYNRAVRKKLRLRLHDLKHKIFVKWMRFKYKWHWYPTKWMRVVKNMKKLIIFYWCWLVIKQEQLRWNLLDCPVDQRQELAEVYYKKYPELFK
ncbi:MAG: hypothetical protein ACTSQJ_00475 [Promethearchaeota archaeon]